MKRNKMKTKENFKSKTGNFHMNITIQTYIHNNITHAHRSVQWEKSAEKNIQGNKQKLNERKESIYVPL